MSQHPRSCSGFLGLQHSQLRLFGPNRADLGPAATPAATRMTRAHPGFVAAFFIDRIGLALDRAHQGEVRREDESLA